jgi:hypothetical protein
MTLNRGVRIGKKEWTRKVSRATLRPIERRSDQFNVAEYRPTSRRPIGDIFRKTAHGAVQNPRPLQHSS